MKKKNNDNLIDSFKNAIEGLNITYKMEKNFRYHIILSLLTILVSLIMNIDSFHLVIIVISISLVLVAELFNTVFEVLIDNFITKKKNKIIKVIKDISAAAVLITSINALVVGYFLIFTKLFKKILNIFKINWVINDTIIFISFIFLILFIIIIKKIINSEKVFKGGWPSGHSALSFSIFALSLMYVNILIIKILIFLLAVIVSKSRIDLKIHSFSQVVSGAIIGFSLTVIISYILGGFVQ